MRALVVGSSGALATVLVVLLAYAWRSHTRAPPPHVPAMVVPQAQGPLEIDGEPEESSWQHAARTGAFTDERGTTARPFTEVRALHDDRFLYLHLYAADEDLRAPKAGRDGPLWLGDRFRIVFRGAREDRTIEVSPRGDVADARIDHGTGREDRAWQAGARVGVDTDGTIDDPRDHDEEWAVELAVPLTALPEPRDDITITIERYDVGGRSRSTTLRHEVRLSLAP